MSKFQNLERKLKKKGVKNTAALAAWIGRKKYGKKKFEELAKKGRKKHGSASKRSKKHGKK